MIPFEDLRDQLIKLNDENPYAMTQRLGKLGIKEAVYHYTTFLPHEIKLNRRCWHIMENYLEVGKCPQCGGTSDNWGRVEVRENGERVGYTKAYRACSKECAKKYNAARMMEAKHGIKDYEFTGKKKKTQEELVWEKHPTIFGKNPNTDGIYNTNQLRVLGKNMDMISFARCTKVIRSLGYHTKFLDDHYDDITPSQRYWHIEHSKLDFVSCDFCDNHSKWGEKKVGNNYPQMYLGYCPDCSDKHFTREIKRAWGKDDYREAQINKYKDEEWLAEFGEIMKNAAEHTVEQWNEEKAPGGYELIERIYEERGDRKNCRLKYTMIHNDCGKEFTMYAMTFKRRSEMDNVEICPHCNPYYSPTSAAEKEVCNWVESIYNGKVLPNKKFNLRGTRHEIDIYLPELKLGIEYNGSYWHSTKNKTRTYHKDKADKFREVGVRLIQVWETDWLYRQDIIKSIISNAMLKDSKRIYARKTDLRVLQFNDVKDFLDYNHIQGHLAGSVYLGLFYEDELRSVMTFNIRDKSKDLWEIGRLATSRGYVVIGGASKMFKFFIRNYEPQEIYTFAFLDFFTGKVYESMGMEFSHNSAPGYFYVDVFGFRYNRRQFSKKQLIKKGIVSNKDPRSETEIMDELGFMKTYNCGNAKYIWRTE
jgi:hypothetical protein